MILLKLFFRMIAKMWWLGTQKYRISMVWSLIQIYARFFCSYSRTLWRKRAICKVFLK